MAAYILTNAVKPLMTSQRLSQKSLSSVNSGVHLPTYDRSKMMSGIVHLGVGAFHRAHQAVFVDDCLKNGEKNWAITAASLRSGETRDALAPQDNLYTLVTRDNTEERLRVIGLACIQLASTRANRKRCTWDVDFWNRCPCDIR